jgi:LmbE family N-acetylglucosaminyl deacetylase
MELRLMCILAHPDDECLGTGGILARYAVEGVETYLVTATRGEHGWWGDEKDYPGPEALGRVREAELRASAQALGLHEVSLLDYIDGELDQAEPAPAIAKIVGHIRRVKPHVVITFGPEGAYGHPDHIAISQFTAAALIAAADLAYRDSTSLSPHRVSKFYYMEDMQDLFEVYMSVFGDLVMHVDGVERRAFTWPRWAVTTRIDTAPYWQTVWQAVQCHRSQFPGYSKFERVSDEQHRVLWGSRTYYRVFSLVNGGRKVEQDLFEGLR